MQAMQTSRDPRTGERGVKPTAAVEPPGRAEPARSNEAPPLRSPIPASTPAAECVTLAATAAAAWSNAVAAFHEQWRGASERTEAAHADLLQQLQRQEARLEQLQRALESVQTEQARTASRLLQSTERLDTHAFNLEQVRTLADNLSRRTEELATDFIERHVTDPLLRDLASLWGELRRILDGWSQQPEADLAALPEHIERLLEAHGAAVIHAPVGAEFDPHAHQPIHPQETPDPTLHGRVAGTFQPGVRCARRVIQPAWVAIFKCQPSTNQTP